MNEHLRPEEAAQALTEIRQRQQEVIDLAVLPTWYWWAIGVSHPATLAAVVGGLGMGIGGPILGRRLRRIMLANRDGWPR